MVEGSKGSEGSKALEEENEGSKARSKRNKGLKAPKNDDQRLEGAFEGR